jgi:hypothetical protein
MKRLLAWGVVFALLLGFGAGCGGGESKTTRSVERQQPENRFPHKSQE